MPETNAGRKLIKGLEAACWSRGVAVPGCWETAARRSQSFAFPERREPLGDPSHAGDPDDSAVFCGESVWAGESGLAWRQGDFNAFRFISRSVWVIFLEEVVSSGERGLGHCRGLGMPQAPAPVAVQPSGSAPRQHIARGAGRGHGGGFGTLASAGSPAAWRGGGSLLHPRLREASAGTWASQSGECKRARRVSELFGLGGEGKRSPVLGCSPPGRGKRVEMAARLATGCVTGRAASGRTGSHSRPPEPASGSPSPGPSAVIPGDAYGGAARSVAPLLPSSPLTCCKSFPRPARDQPVP